MKEKPCDCPKCKKKRDQQFIEIECKSQWGEKIKCSIEKEKIRGLRGFSGAQGPQGAQGPVGPSVAQSFGSLYNVNIVKLNPLEKVDFNQSGPFFNASFDLTNGTIIIQDFGVYEITFYTDVLAENTQVVVLTVFQNETPIYVSSTTTENQSGGLMALTSGKTIQRSLNPQDTISVRSTAGTVIALKNTALTIKRLQ